VKENNNFDTELVLNEFRIFIIEIHLSFSAFVL